MCIYQYMFVYTACVVCVYSRKMIAISWLLHVHNYLNFIRCAIRYFKKYAFL